MSTYYNFYTEVKIGETWHLVDPIGLYIKYDGSFGTTVYQTYWNGSRSYFSDTYEKLCGVASPLRFQDASIGFQKCKIDDLANSISGEERTYEEITKEAEEWMNGELKTVSYHSLCELMPKPGEHQYHGVYHKDMIAAFKSGDTDYLDTYDGVDVDTYLKMDTTMRAAYEYFEWDDPMSWWHYMPILKQLVDNRVADFSRSNFIEPEDVRILMYTS